MSIQKPTIIVTILSTTKNYGMKLPWSPLGNTRLARAKVNGYLVAQQSPRDVITQADNCGEEWEPVYCKYPVSGHHGMINQFQQRERQRTLFMIWSDDRKFGLVHQE